MKQLQKGRGHVVDEDPVLEWVERVAMYLARDGVPPIAGRVLGWLMACDPPERTRPGDRTVYFRMADDAWAVVVRRQIAGVTSFLDITRAGLNLVWCLFEAVRSARTLRTAV